MSLSRRAFVQMLGLGGAGVLTSAYVSARGREDVIWGGLDTSLPDWPPGTIIISSNENPLGPGQTVLKAVRAAIGADGRAPGRYPRNGGDLVDAIAQKFKVKPANVLIGCGSTQILRTVTHISTSKTRPLVGSTPTYEECVEYAKLVGHPVKSTPSDSQLRMDLDVTLTAVQGAGLLFFCNPSNPTATAYHSDTATDFIQRVLLKSGETAILVDEAYIDYCTMPGHKTLIPLAVENPRVIVTRTFSKAYGMAGLRIGYAIAHPQTIKQMADWESDASINVLAIAGAIAAIEQDASFIERERARNTEVREFTRRFFHKAGYNDTESQTNFLFVDVRQPIKQFQAACREQGVRVGRPFPPLTTHARISLGTMEEMQRATEVFSKVLGIATKAAA